MAATNAYKHLTCEDRLSLKPVLEMVLPNLLSLIRLAKINPLSVKKSKNIVSFPPNVLFLLNAPIIKNASIRVYVQLTVLIMSLSLANAATVLPVPAMVVAKYSSCRFNKYMYKPDLAHKEYLAYLSIPDKASI